MQNNIIFTRNKLTLKKQSFSCMRFFYTLSVLLLLKDIKDSHVNIITDLLPPKNKKDSSVIL